MQKRKSEKHEGTIHKEELRGEQGVSNETIARSSKLMPNRIAQPARGHAVLFGVLCALLAVCFLQIHLSRTQVPAYGRSSPSDASGDFAAARNTDVRAVNPASLTYILVSRKTVLDVANLAPQLGGEQFWERLVLQQPRLSYTTALEVLTREFLPALSVGLVAACLGVIFAVIAAGFVVTWYWSSWTPVTQIVVCVCYMIGFMAGSKYMWVAKEEAMQIPGGILALAGVSFVVLANCALWRLNGVDPAWRSRAFQASIHTSLCAAAILAYIIVPFAPLVAVGAITAAAVLDLFDNQHLYIVSFTFAVLLGIIANGAIGRRLQPLQQNEFFPIVTDVITCVDLTAWLLGFLAITMTVLLETRLFVDSSLRASSYVGCSVCAIIWAVYNGDIIPFLFGHAGVLLFLFSIFTKSENSMFRYVYCLLNLTLMLLAYGIRDASELLVGIGETLSNCLLGPVGLVLWSASMLMVQSSPLSTTLVLLLNLLLIGFSIVTSRSIVLMFGLFGVTAYLVRIGSTVFKGSASFTVFLTCVAVCSTLLGVQLSKFVREDNLTV